jgi:hypothetical protein
MKYLNRIHVGLALATLWLLPAGALAEGESLSRLEAMETRLMALEDKPWAPVTPHFRASSTTS